MAFQTGREGEQVGGTKEEIKVLAGQRFRFWEKQGIGGGGAGLAGR